METNYIEELHDISSNLNTQLNSDTPDLNSLLVDSKFATAYLASLQDDLIRILQEIETITQCLYRLQNGVKRGFELVENHSETDDTLAKCVATYISSGGDTKLIKDLPTSVEVSHEKKSTIDTTKLQTTATLLVTLLEGIQHASEIKQQISAIKAFGKTVPESQTNTKPTRNNLSKDTKIENQSESTEEDSESSSSEDEQENERPKESRHESRLHSGASQRSSNNGNMVDDCVDMKQDSAVSAQNARPISSSNNRTSSSMSNSRQGNVGKREDSTVSAGNTRVKSSSSNKGGSSMSNTNRETKENTKQLKNEVSNMDRSNTMKQDDTNKVQQRSQVVGHKEVAQNKKELAEQEFRRNPKNWPVYGFDRTSLKLQPVDEDTEQPTTFVFYMAWVDGDADLYRMKCTLRDDLPALLHGRPDELVISSVIHMVYDGGFKAEVPAHLFIKLRNTPDMKLYKPPQLLLSVDGGPCETVKATRKEMFGETVWVCEIPSFEIIDMAMICEPLPTTLGQINDADGWPVFCYIDYLSSLKGGDIICLVRAKAGTLHQKDLQCVRYKWDTTEITKLENTYVATNGETILSEMFFLENQRSEPDFEVAGSKRHIQVALPFEPHYKNTDRIVVKMSTDLFEWTALKTTTPRIPGYQDLSVAEIELEELEEAYFVVTAETCVDHFELSSQGGICKSSSVSDVKVIVSGGTFTKSHETALDMKVLPMPDTHVKTAAKKLKRALLGAGPLVELQVSGGNDSNFRMEIPKPNMNVTSANKLKKGEKSAFYLMARIGRADWSLMSHSESGNKIIFYAPPQSKGALVLSGVQSIPGPLLQKAANSLERSVTKKVVSFILASKTIDEATRVCFACVPINKEKEVLHDIRAAGYKEGPGKIKEFLIYDGQRLQAKWKGDVQFRDAASVTLVYCEFSDPCIRYMTVEPRSGVTLLECFGQLQLLEKNDEDDDEISDVEQLCAAPLTIKGNVKLLTASSSAGYKGSGSGRGKRTGKGPVSMVPFSRSLRPV